MNKKKITIATIIASLLLIVGVFSFGNSTQAATKKKYVQESIPTIFFHGYASSYHAEEQMTGAIKKAGVTKTIVRVNVSPNGYAKMIGSIPKKAKNPVVEVNFDNSRNGDYHTQGQWAKNVIKVVQEDYKCKKVNLVGHSMGNMAINYYILDNPGLKGLPKINKVVDIAGHFDGIIDEDDEPKETTLDKNGKPDRMNSFYKELMELRKTYPTNIKVLNIYGDKDDGTHSDGAVTNASSKSLKYLVSGRAKSYQEKKIVGKMAAHSKLHENKQVDKILINFLFKK